MARILTGALVTDIRGKVGGSIFQGGAYGLVMKNKNKTCNKNSLSQSTRRNALASLMTSWRALTDAQRQAWSLWASYQKLQHGYFKQRVMSGRLAFFQVNIYLLMLGQSIITEPIFSPYSLATSDLVLYLDNSDIWLQTETSGLYTGSLLIARFSLALSSGRYTKPSRLLWLPYVNPSGGIYVFTNAWHDHFGNLPPEGSSVWVDYFFIQLSNKTLGPLVSQKMLSVWAG